MKSFGISNPQEESRKKQISYLVKNNMDTSYVFDISQKFINRFSNNNYPVLLKDSIKEDVYFIQSRIYDNNGIQTFNWASCYGHPKLYFYNDSIINIKENFSQNLTLQMISKEVVQKEIFDELINSASTYIIVSFWGTYMGKPSKERMLFFDLLSQNYPSKYKHIKINMGNFGG
jgi:hypothetical protein